MTHRGSLPTPARLGFCEMENTPITGVSRVGSQEFARRVVEFPKTWAVGAHCWKAGNQ